MLLCKGAQRLDPSGEALEEDRFVAALPWRWANAQRDLGDHTEDPLRTDQHLAHARAGGAPGRRRQLDLAGGRAQPQPRHHLLYRAIPAGRLARRPRGGAAAERYVLKGLREMPQRQATLGQMGLELAGAHANETRIALAAGVQDARRMIAAHRLVAGDGAQRLECALAEHARREAHVGERDRRARIWSETNLLIEELERRPGEHRQAA